MGDDNLPRYTLSKNQKKDVWELKDRKGQVIEDFERKGDATKGGVLEDAVGKKGGSVQIKTEKGRIQEERTYPGSKDPKKSPG